LAGGRKNCAGSFAGSPYAKLIIAPHDLKRVSHLKQLFPEAILYSEINSGENFNSNILIIDSIGLLSKLYSYADVAVVGGGFHDAGLHNILEAATFGVPVIFGNHYRKILKQMVLFRRMEEDLLKMQVLLQICSVFN
jgi:3-deoxy-D-manno-octulosonic-acid transferase